MPKDKETQKQKLNRIADLLKRQNELLDELIEEVNSLNVGSGYQVRQIPDEWEMDTTGTHIA